MESGTKSAVSPCFELYDYAGNINVAGLNASLVDHQYFNLFGYQLNTDSHHTESADLLTQFMKVSVMNTADNNKYKLGKKSMSGTQIRDVYKNIIDILTRRGYAKFSDEWGIDGTRVDRKKFMTKLRQMAQTEGLPASTIAGFNVDSDGNFIIHPSAMPNISWIISRLIAQQSDSVIDTTTPGKALYQVASVGFDNILSVQQSADKHLLMPGEINPNTGNLNDRMQVRLSIGFFRDLINKAKKAGVKGLDNFYGQRDFILANKDLIALSYRVPTQG
jgi:hypothetical protein